MSCFHSVGLYVTKAFCTLYIYMPPFSKFSLPELERCTTTVQSPTAVVGGGESD